MRSLMGGLTAYSATKMPGDVEMPARGPVTRFLFFVTICRASRLGLTYYIRMV
jgi:hypothetical protein